MQSTFLRAIEARASWDAQRPIQPWLCGILHNCARARRRRDERAPDPARLTPVASADPARAAEDAELGAALDAAIARLPEIYRPVLRLHLGRAHAPAEIADALGRPPGTVRSQLARGLELLRRALPQSLVGALAVAMHRAAGSRRSSRSCSRRRRPRCKVPRRKGPSSEERSR